MTYLGVRGPVDEWRSFATDVLGLQVGDGSTDTELKLRMDDRAHRITVQAGDPGLAFLGFEMSSRPELDELAGRLRDGGVEVTEDPELAEKRQVRHLLRCQDPAGNDVELVVAHLGAKSAFVSPRGVTFKTGSQGLGHAVLLVPDHDAAWTFYVDLLGFRLSDTIDLRFAVLTFLHCNPRHHTLAFGEVKGVNRLAHFMLEVDELEHVGRAYDVMLDRDKALSMSLGMHTNDHMISFYAKTPSGFDVEYGCNGREVDDATWTVGHYDAPSYWGHRRAVAPTAPRPA